MNTADCLHGNGDEAKGQSRHEPLTKVWPDSLGWPSTQCVICETLWPCQVRGAEIDAQDALQ